MYLNILVVSALTVSWSRYALDVLAHCCRRNGGKIYVHPYKLHDSFSTVLSERSSIHLAWI